MNIYSGVKRDRRIRNTTNSKFLSKSCKSDPCLNLLENKLSNDSGSAEDESTKADIVLLWHIQQLFFKTYVHQTNDRFSFCFVLFSWLIRVLAKPAVNRLKRLINQEIENGKMRIEKTALLICCELELQLRTVCLRFLFIATPLQRWNQQHPAFTKSPFPRAQRNYKFRELSCKQFF